MEMLAKVSCLALILCMVVVVAPHAEAITCGQVSGGLAPCLTYLTRGGRVPANCCRGVRSLNAAAKTTADRRTACNCLKLIASSIRSIKLGNANALASKCHFRIPYKISPSINCSKVK